MMDRVGSGSGSEHKYLALEAATAAPVAAEEESGAGAAEAGAAVPKAKDCTLALPEELILQIFSWLDDPDWARAFVVCRRWCTISLDKIDRELKGFSERQIPLLSHIVTNVITMGPGKIEVMPRALGLCKWMVDFNNPVQHLETYTALVAVCEKLVDDGTKEAIDKAFDLCKKIPHFQASLVCQERYPVFSAVCQKLVEDGTTEGIDKALDLCQKINHYRMEYQQAYGAIFSKLAEIDNGENGTIDKALQLIANRGFADYQKMILIKVICKKLVEKGDVDKALKIANTITQYRDQLDVIRMLCQTLVEIEQTDQAIEVANRITNEHFKSAILQGICEKLVEREDIKTALEVAKRIPGKDQKDKALECICRKLAKKGSIEEALNLVKTMISDAPSKTVTLDRMAYDLLKMEQPEKALYILSKMRMQYRKRVALVAVCEKYLSQENIEQAQVVANMIPANEREHTQALSWISYKRAVQGI